MKMPMFTWSSLITSLIVIFAFPVLTVALALMSFDRLFGTAFFTLTNGGLPMMWANLFWVWGIRKYILLFCQLSVFSQRLFLLSRGKIIRLSGDGCRDGSYFFTKFPSLGPSLLYNGIGALVNSFFSITTMMIAIPTGIKIFNWLFTMYKGRITFTTPMLWSLAFIPNFVVGGVTGVMLAMAAADYQYHNTYFLVSHFHYVLIAGTVFSCFAGLTYWYPKWSVTD